ncbi:hypothetical protein C8Q80DRAFT_46891 [Daedaleopsis nitida]|nr:hypothetical protein C8Q80DRAFT_46891 [Daedaleopsis nitida]
MRGGWAVDASDAGNLWPLITGPVAIVCPAWFSRSWSCYARKTRFPGTRSSSADSYRRCSTEARNTCHQTSSEPPYAHDPQVGLGPPARGWTQVPPAGLPRMVCARDVPPLRADHSPPHGPGLRPFTHPHPLLSRPQSELVRQEHRSFRLLRPAWGNPPCSFRLLRSSSDVLFQ